MAHIRLSDVSFGALYCYCNRRHQWEMAPNPVYKRNSVFGRAGTPGLRKTEVCASCHSRRFRVYSTGFGKIIHQGYEYTEEYQKLLDEDLTTGERRALYYRSVAKMARDTPTAPKNIYGKELVGPLRG